MIERRERQTADAKSNLIVFVKRCKPWKDPRKVNQQEVKRAANWANAVVSSIHINPSFCLLSGI